MDQHPTFKIKHKGEFVRPLTWQLRLIQDTYRKYCESNNRSVCCTFRLLNNEFECVYGENSYIRNIRNDIVQYIKTTWEGLKQEKWPMIIELDENGKSIQIARGWPLYHMRKLSEKISLNEAKHGYAPFLYYGQKKIAYINNNSGYINDIATGKTINFSIRF